jgi:EmrB/QacA subfamily drug resistance transporter
VVALDSYVLVTALPTLSARLGASTSQLQWIQAAYVLVSAGLMLPAGKIADRIGRRRMLLGGLAIFGIASVIASQAHTAVELIGMRAAMGAGAAVIMPMVLAILPSICPAPRERRRGVAAITVGAMLGLPLGPLLAGWMLTHFYWGSVFLINGPIAALSLAGVAFGVSESKDPAATRLDWAGAALAAAGVTGVVYGIIEQPARGWDATVLAGLTGGAACLAGFVLRQLTAGEPLVDLGIFASRAFTWGTIAFAVITAAMSGVLFVLPTYLQVVRGSSAQGTGLRLLPMIGALLAAAGVSEKLAARLGARILIPAGMLVSAAGLILLSLARAGGGYGIVALALAVFGIGLGLSLPLAADSVIATLPPAQTGVGNAMSRTLQGVGVAAGAAVMGSVLNGGYRARLAGAGGRLPGPAAATARSSVAGAHAVAGRLPAGSHARLTLYTAADQAYVHGMFLALLVGFALLAVTALLALLFLPGRQPDGLALGEEHAPRSVRLIKSLRSRTSRDVTSSVRARESEREVVLRSQPLRVPSWRKPLLERRQSWPDKSTGCGGPAMWCWESSSPASWPGARRSTTGSR